MPARPRRAHPEPRRWVMNAMLNGRFRSHVAAAAAIAAALVAMAIASPAPARPVAPAPAAAAPVILTQGWCVYRVGDYPSQDHAFQVRNNLAARGIDSWIENHGSLYAGTRSYVVFARGPCR